MDPVQPLTAPYAPPRVSYPAITSRHHLSKPHLDYHNALHLQLVWQDTKTNIHALRALTVYHVGAGNGSLNAVVDKHSPLFETTSTTNL